MVDWHIQIQHDEVSFVYNRTDPPRIVEKVAFTRDNAGILRSEAFEQIVGRKPNPNLPALDDALINTLSFWKRNLSAELGYEVSNESLSSLLNAVIFVRATEDHSKRLNRTDLSSQVLLDTWQRPERPPLIELLLISLERLGYTDIPSYLINVENLKVFEALDRTTIFSFLSDFYRNRFASMYDYDFSLISQHALSRIYEHYVSLLRLKDTPQGSLFPSLPEEEKDKRYGSFYTPQYIARFFARFLREQMPPRLYRNLHTADPACGSGIFLRTLLELQCDPAQDNVGTEVTQTAFSNAFGIDVDQNACQAALLSLSLLHLVLTDQLPQALNVISAEAIEYFQQNPQIIATFDAVIANPPFISLRDQSPGMRERLSVFMKDYATGQLDTYLAFLRIGIEMLKPGGYGLFVIPHSFLLSKSATKTRQYLLQTSWIRCIADLSAIRVFDDTNTYVVLLILQKKTSSSHDVPIATVAKCQDMVGKALQDLVEGRRVENSFYSVYDVEQETFKKDNWSILPPREAAVQRRMLSLPTLGDFLKIRKGLISGADDIFIVNSEQVPKGEEAIFVPFLHDREMKRYKVPETTSRQCFYPYINGRKIDESQLVSDFPQTYAYLDANRTKLTSRSSLKRYRKSWWEPMWSRPPENMMRPKIVSPHLAIVPRFAVDIDGKYAISQAPLFYPKNDQDADEDLLLFFVAVLNSTPCYWYISNHSHTYQRGYAMLEPVTLGRTPVPDLAQVSATSKRRLLNLVNDRLSTSGSDALQLERRIDEAVSEMYGLSYEDRLALGMEEKQGDSN